jgi:hypothetical protein
MEVIKEANLKGGMKKLVLVSCEVELTLSLWKKDPKLYR